MCEMNIKSLVRLDIDSGLMQRQTRHSVYEAIDFQGLFVNYVEKGLTNF